jgi:hypothetical protein
MSTNNSNDTNDSHDQLEPFPTDGEVRDHEAAEKEMSLEYQSVFKIGNDVFEYRGIDVGEAVVNRLSEPSFSRYEKIPMTELWESYQRNNLKIGRWCCQFVAEDDPAADNT